jgi:transcription antitermination protein NusB
VGTRRQARECALQILYQLDGRDQQDGAWETVRVEEATTRFFLHFEAPEKARAMAVDLVKGVAAHKAAVDEKLRKHSPRWKLERMALVDRNVLRIGAYEILFKKDVPTNVAIDEAVEVAKRFGTDTSAAFVNGVLDGVAKEGPA